MAALVPHKLEINNKTYYAKLPDVYDNGADYNIGSALGISRLGDTEEIDATADTIEIGDGIKTGKLMRIRISYQDATDNNKSKSSQVVCPVDKAKTAITAVLSKTYKASNIKSAGIPRRRRLG